MQELTFLLVHGGWAGAWVWEKLEPELADRGLKSKAIDCIGYASKKKFGWTVSAIDIARDIVAEAGRIEGPVALVGHSSGGLAISRAAALAPDGFAGLVYLCAFLPRNGDHLLQLIENNEGSDFGNLLKPDLMRGVVTIDTSQLDHYLFHDCTSEDAEAVVARFGGEPLRLGTAKVRLPDAFDKLPKHYVACTDDRALSLAFQKWMVDRQSVSSYTELNAGHMPMYSLPAQLADRLAELTDRF